MPCHLLLQQAAFLRAVYTLPVPFCVPFVSLKRLCGCICVTAIIRQTMRQYTL